MGTTTTTLGPPPAPPQREFFHNEPPYDHGIHLRSRHENMEALARDMTIEEEKRIIDELFAEWEDGVNDKGEKPSTGPEQYNQKDEQDPRLFNGPSLVPCMGTTRRLMIDVEREAQKKETLMKKVRETHTLEEPVEYFEREPGERRRRTYERRPRRRRPVVVNIGERYGGDNGIEREVYSHGDEFIPRFERQPSVLTSERHERDRAVPREMMGRERFRRRPSQNRVVLSPLPERLARDSEMRILETRSPRTRAYTSGSESWSEDEEAVLYSSDD